MSTKFELLPNEQKAAEEFKAAHYQNCKRYDHYTDEPYGPGLIYVFQATGIGTAVSVKCTSCGVVLDVTDYDTW